MRWLAGVLTATVVALSSAAASAAPPSTTAPPADDPVEEGGGVTDDGGAGDPGPPLTLPLIPVPVGCTVPSAAHLVFLGTVVDRDYRTIRYRIDQVKWGRTAPFAAADSAATLDGDSGEVIDVRYGLDAQYLADGERYLVGAVVDPNLGLLVSRVNEKVENFGGDEVIGVSETDVDCPAFEDPERTLHPDGTVVDGSMLQPFFEAKWRIAASVLIPLGAACGALFLLSAFKLAVFGALRRLLRPAR